MAHNLVRLQELGTVIPTLSQFAREYTNESLVAKHIFKPVPINAYHFKVPIFDKESFKIYKTGTAIGTDTPIIPPSAKKKKSFTIEAHQLAALVTKEENEVSPDDENRIAQNKVTEGMNLEQEYLMSKLAQDDSKYHASHVITLTGADLFSDPDSDIETKVIAWRKTIRRKIHKEPNSAVIGLDMYYDLLKHKQVKAYAYGTSSAARAATIEEIKKVLKVKHLSIGAGLFVDANGKEHEMWGNNLIYYWNPEGKVKKGDPCFAYFFQHKRWPVIDRYDNKSKSETYIRETNHYGFEIVGKDAGLLIKMGA